ncbi:MAG: hypothetical protein P1U56_06090 [Saprospiraceae bacterium]|nr:hypothetical protein [Saprospiraceae bacterium]
MKTLTYNASEKIDEIAMVRSDKKERCDCLDPNNYIPDARFPQFDDIKYIRVNFHYPNASDSSYNFVREEAVIYSKGLLQSGNNKLKKNKKMNLPEGNDTPVYDAGYRYLLQKDPTTTTGYAVYEDIDDENWYFIKKGKNKNNYSRTVIKKFARNDDTILNIFAMAYPPDSIGRKGFSSGRAGIALGNSLKIAGIRKYGVNGAWRFSALMNHEIGHVYGLRHSWYKNDGCDDTPPNPNCWGSKKEGPCAGVTSNNMMDYNNQQIAITPCQIGMVKKSMHRESGKARKLLVKDWCEYDANKSLIISEDLQLDRAIDMKGDIIIEANASLRLSCRVHMPKGGKIIVQPGATLILNGCKIHNDCGESWGGIEVQSKGKVSGKIEYLGRVTIDNLPDNL